MPKLWAPVGPAAAGLTLVLLGCSAASEAAEERRAALEIVDVSELSPTDDTDVLQLVIDGEGLWLSLEELESFEMVRVPSSEPFVETDSVFEGPLLATVLANRGIPADAAIELAAVDDGTYEMALADALASNAVIATREWGAPIDLSAGGPVRIVFPDGSGPAGEEHRGAWVRSLTKIELR